ncbi:hypothetical protein ACVIJ6_004783 [Bradyrhizobium sp. USDA 4369]
MVTKNAVAFLPLPACARATACDDRSYTPGPLQAVMPGLVPGIHVVRHPGNDVDARDEPGHDDVTNWLGLGEAAR